jgi:hypothetical protein
MQLMRSAGVSSFVKCVRREVIRASRASFTSSCGHHRMWSSVSGSSLVQLGQFASFLPSILF